VGDGGADRLKQRPAGSHPERYASPSMFGGDGNDVLIVGRGETSEVEGGPGDDRLSASGFDYLTGGPGNDVLRGGPGEQFLGGQTGDDLLVGDAGSDTLQGGPGADRVFGGPGQDYYYLAGGGTGDVLVGGEGRDLADFCCRGRGALPMTVDLLAGVAHGDGWDDVLSEIEDIHGGLGDDVLRGDDGPNGLDGSSGDDTIEGLGGNDSLNGAGGDDSLNGGEDTDSANGGDGTDTCEAETIVSCEKQFPRPLT
jgi:Ca2+-binding RTX toxin-like protein